MAVIIIAVGYQFRSRPRLAINGHLSLPDRNLF
jgi:hypothetical protein